MLFSISCILISLCIYYQFAQILSFFAPGKTSRSVTHPEIALGQARLTPEFFADELPKNKVYLDGMSILSILLSLESICHNLILGVDLSCTM
jgi:hypothetical protein